MTRSAGSVRRWPRSLPRWASRRRSCRSGSRQAAGAVEPFVMLQGQALLAVLDQGVVIRGICRWMSWRRR